MIEIEILKNTQSTLDTIQVFKYIDEDWGQLADYGSAPPVNWPCALIDITAVSYNDIGTDRSAKPQNRQQGSATITFTFADLKLTNSSAKTSAGQKQKAWQIHEYIEKAHEVLQGLKPVSVAGGLIRSGKRKIKRDDGVQQFQVTYTIGMHNV